MSFFPKQPSSRLGATQTIEFDVSAAIKNPFGPETYQIRLVSDEPCCYRIGDGKQTATTSDVFLPANVIEYVIVSPGMHISAVGIMTAGILWVTEAS